MDEIRRARYATLRSVLLPYTPGGAVEGDPGEEGISSIVIPPLAWAVGKTLAEVRARGAEVAFTALRRQGITGRDLTPTPCSKEAMCWWSMVSPRLSSTPRPSCWLVKWFP